MNQQYFPWSSRHYAGFQFDTEDADKVLPGFADAIIGIQCGETKSFPLTFPDSWRQENLRGVNARFTVSVSQMQPLKAQNYSNSVTILTFQKKLSLHTNFSDYNIITLHDMRSHLIRSPQ